MSDDKKLIEAVVAPGRTVHAGKKSVGPGGKISLPTEEVVDLRANGFLVDPDAKAIPRADGPSFTVKNVPNAKVAA